MIEFRTRDARESIDFIKAELFDAAKAYAAWERKLHPEYLENLKSQLVDKEHEIRAHQDARLREVPAPNEASNDEQQEGRIEFERLEAALHGLDQDIGARRAEVASLNERVEKANQAMSVLKNLESYVSRAKDGLVQDVKDLGLSIDDLVAVSIAYEPIEAAIADLNSRRAVLTEELAPDHPSSLHVKRELLLKRREEIRAALDAPARAFAIYQAELLEWAQRLAQLEGDENTPGTRRYFEAKIKEIDKANAELANAKKRLREAAEKIFSAKEKILRVSEELYDPVRHFIATHPVAGGRLSLEFSVAFSPGDFEERFLQQLNQGRRGSFYGQQDGRARLGDLVKQADFTSAEGILAFLDAVMRALEIDLRADETRVFIADQVRRGFEVTELLTYLFGLDYLEPRFELRWQGKPLHRLSPGERGTLLLIFFLLVDDA